MAVGADAAVGDVVGGCWVTGMVGATVTLAVCTGDAVEVLGVGPAAHAPISTSVAAVAA